MLYVDPSYAFAAPMYRSGASFSWAPSSPNSLFMIKLQPIPAMAHCCWGMQPALGQTMAS